MVTAASGSSEDGGLAATVRAWIAHDPDPQTRAELTQLLERADHDDRAHAELVDRFAGHLQFGTAGLRGELAAGPNRMNRAVVSGAAAGLAAFLRRHAGTGTVVIGYDARYRSDEFARDTAEVITGAGLDAVLLPRPLPTPVLAYAIRRLGCIAGVMVTASHNPARDNGYKVYLGDGAQIAPPVDAEIAAEIAAVGPVGALPRSAARGQLPEDVVEAYVESVAALAEPRSPRDIDVVYTPLHGVGRDVTLRVLQAAGFPPPTVVADQADPDPDFPTLAFPNPEEPGALDLANVVAAARGADLVLANDPDADRLAVALPTAHGLRMLRGDEVGALLADRHLRRGGTGTLATTIVSSSLLATMAADAGAAFAQTLTGFKWIARVPALGFGYEEALGYCVAPDLVRDKDGISALLQVAELAAELKAEGLTLRDRLDQLARRYGLHATDQLSARFADLAAIHRTVDRLTRSAPTVLGGLPVQSVVDLSEGADGLPPTAGVRYVLAERGRVVVRPSGTEPKLKCYLEVVVDVAAGDVDAARISAAGRLDAIRADLIVAAGLSSGAVGPVS